MFDPTSTISTTAQKNIQQMVRAQQNLLETLPNMSGSAFQQAVAQAYGEMLHNVLLNPQTLMEVQAQWWDNQVKLWLYFWGGLTGQTVEPVVAPHPKDRRFQSEDWKNNHFYNYLMQSYLANSSALHKTIKEYTDDSDKSGRVLHYHVRQLIDALAPSNYFLTNPDAIQKAIETRGMSLMDGFTNFFRDLNQGRLTMTDTKHFKVGQNIAVTPGAVVYENELMQLIQYSPSTEQVYEVPVMVIPPWINKFYILDLQAKTSYAKFIVDQGFTTFMVSWRNPSDDLGGITWEDYMELGILQPLAAIEKITGQKQANAVGYCIGGTLLASVQAYLKAKKEDRIKSATYLAAMIDFTDPGELSIFIDDAQIHEREREYLDGGVYPGNVMSNAFAMLRANDLVWSYVINNYLKGEDYTPFDLLYWNSDPTNLPGSMYLYYIRNMYLENNLVKPNCLELLDQPIDVTSVDTPVMIIACEQDHIAPWNTVYNGVEVFGGKDKHFILSESGHIAGIVNPPGKKKRRHWHSGEQGQGPQHFLQTAKEEPDSWWPTWSAWLAGHSGKQVAPPKALGSTEYPEIEPAPGRYVTEEVDVTGYAM